MVEVVRWWGGGWDHHCDHSQISESPGWVDRPSFGWRLRQWEASVLTETTQKLQLSHSALRTGQQQVGGKYQTVFISLSASSIEYFRRKLSFTILNHRELTDFFLEVKKTNNFNLSGDLVQQRRSAWPLCRWCRARRAGWWQISPPRTTGTSPALCQSNTRLVRLQWRSEEGSLTSSVIVLISSKVTAEGQTFSTFTVDMNLSDSSLSSGLEKFGVNH